MAKPVNLEAARENETRPARAAELRASLRAVWRELAADVPAWRYALQTTCLPCVKLARKNRVNPACPACAGTGRAVVPYLLAA